MSFPLSGLAHDQAGQRRKGVGRLAPELRAEAELGQIRGVVGRRLVVGAEQPAAE